MTHPFSRRRFLAALPILGTGCQTASFEPDSGTGVARAPAPEVIETLRRVLPVPERARVLGEAYLWELRPRPSAAELCASLGPIEATNAAQALAERIAEDYDSGRVVSVAGWLLSRTEATLAAIAAL